MAARLVLKGLGEDVPGKGKGKGSGGKGRGDQSSRRSPKRESEGGIPDGRRRRGN